MRTRLLLGRLRCWWLRQRHTDGRVLAIAAPSEAEEAADERDRLVEMRGDQRGGFVLALFALAAMASAMTAQPYYLIANLVLAGLVASELVKGVSKLIGYRRGV